MGERIPAEVFPPGEFIREELEARGWNQIDLAAILGRATRDISEIITAKRSITPETAKQLAAAFGTDPRLWMNLESAYRLSRAGSADDTVSRRARLYEIAPVREMVRRHWIEPSENIGVLEKRVADFFEVPSLDQPFTFMSHATRKSTSYQTATVPQLAWLFRAKKLSKAVFPKKFSEKSLGECLKQLKQILPNAEDIRQISNILSESGVRLLIVEPLPQTKIDGVCFWLDKQSPVIALSLRYDRIDWFWRTLLHELAHVQNKDGMNKEVTIDTDLVGEQPGPYENKPVSEQHADKFATEFSVPGVQLSDFIARVRPLYSGQKIRGFAARIGVHPGIVIGQLQYRGEISYAHSRKMLVKVRHIVTSSALTDGWGYMPPAIM